MFRVVTQDRDSKYEIKEYHIVNFGIFDEKGRLLGEYASPTIANMVFENMVETEDEQLMGEAYTFFMPPRDYGVSVDYDE